MAAYEKVMQVLRELGR